MSNFELFTERNVPKVLIYGDSGTGKTELATTLAREFNVIVLDLDNSLESWRKLPQDCWPRITYVRIVEDVKSPKAHVTVNRILGGTGTIKLCVAHGRETCLECARKAAKPYEINLDSLNPDNTVIVIDNQTRYSDSHFAAVTDDIDLEGVGNGHKPEFDHWGSLMNRMNNFQNLVQYCRFPTVVISHSQFLEVKQGQNAFYPMGGSRKTMASLGRIYSTIVFMFRQGQGFASTSNGLRYPMSLAKSREDIDVDVSNPETFLDVFRAPAARRVFTPEVIADIVDERKAKAAAALAAKISQLKQAKTGAVNATKK